MGALESGVAQPRATFDGVELYQSLEEKAAALGFSMFLNHPFIDGNQRIGHASLEVFVVLNGSQSRANVDNAESMILGVAAGTVAREAFVQGIRAHMTAYLSWYHQDPRAGYPTSIAAAKGDEVRRVTEERFVLLRSQPILLEPLQQNAVFARPRPLAPFHHRALAY